MGRQGLSDEGKNALFSWLVVTALSVGILLWGFAIFFTVGTGGPGEWDFSVIEDIPGESPYSTWTPNSKEFPGPVRHPVVDGPRVEEQHVDGREPKLPLPGGAPQ